MNDPEREAHLLSGAYALHAVTPAEARAFEAVMRDLEELRGEVVGLTDTAVALGLAVRPTAPPPALRGSLLALIEQTPQLAADPAPQHVAPRRRRRILRRPVVLLVTAAVAVLLFGGGVLVQGALVEPQLQYSRVVAAADARATTATVRGGGAATVTWSRSEGTIAVALKGVPVPAGRTLQLWSIRGGTTTSQGLLQGQVELLHRLPLAGEQLAVSVEPTGGSKQPTATPIVVVPLPA